MRLQVLGSNAGGPARANAGSGYLVETADSTIWLDAGPGTFMALAAIVDPSALDAVVVSHTHVDHCADLLALFAHLAHGRQPIGHATVYGPVGIRDHIAAFARAGEGHVLHDVLTFVEAEPGDVFALGGATVRFGAAVHPVPALVTRIDATDGGSLTYSGDTGPGGDLIELATGSGTLLCEATMQGIRDEATYPYHLTAWEVGDVAATAGVFDVVLTHVPAWLDPAVSIDQAAAAYAGRVAYAAPGSTFKIARTE